MTEKEKCFIIMPISTPATHIEHYRDGKDHFQHILECLITPAVNEAGYDPIPPKSQGSENIPADIIQNLENSNIVICDLSTLNPNVFFEFGIRTSLNKPVCVIKDDLTENIPFDTNTINNHTYINTIDPWILPSEIKKLKEHLQASIEKSKGQNSLWRYFGMKSEAIGMSKSDISSDDKFDYLLNQFDSLKSQINQIYKRVDRKPLSTYNNSFEFNARSDYFVSILDDFFQNLHGVKVDSFEFDTDGFSIKYRGEITPIDKERLYSSLTGTFGDEITLSLHNIDTDVIQSYGT